MNYEDIQDHKATTKNGNHIRTGKIKMATLAHAESINELKIQYRRLAAIHHPDRGGCSSTMQKINKQYRIMKERLKFNECANDTKKPCENSTATDNFSRIKPGIRLFVNGTPCEVLRVDESTFHAIAVNHQRQAVFCKKTGQGKYNQKIRASFTKQEKPTTH